MAIAQLENLKCVTNRPDKLLKMTIGSKHALNATIASYYSREIAYNLEHMIHHMALIKVALKVMGIPLTGDDFGVAYSTLQYKKELCAP